MFGKKWRSTAALIAVCLGCEAPSSWGQKKKKDCPNQPKATSRIKAPRSLDDRKGRFIHFIHLQSPREKIHRSLLSRAVGQSPNLTSKCWIHLLFAHQRLQCPWSVDRTRIVARTKSCMGLSSNLPSHQVSTVVQTHAEASRLKLCRSAER